MKKLFVLLFILLGMSYYTMAQTADWLVSPKYEKISYFGPQMYKVTINGKVGIIGTDGRVILQPEYDAINLFYEGRAVFVNREDNGWKLMGVLSDNGNVQYCSGDYYLLKDYMFYSEGFLTVRNADGLYGYLNEKCEKAFPFTEDIVYPFSEGFAVVGEGENFHWLDTSGNEIYLRLSNGGSPYGGTNFYNGQAYLWDEDGVFFILDANGKTRKIPSRELVVDYLYRPDSDYGLNVTYESYEAKYSSQWLPEERDGQWSYLNTAGKLLTPFQYDEVQKFISGSAIASVDGKYGILHVVDDKSTFSTKTKKSNHIFSAGGICNCEFQLFVPEKWQGQPINVILKDPDSGNEVSIKKHGSNNFQFSYKPNSDLKEEDKTFKIEVKNNGIQLWQGEETFIFQQRTKLTSSIRLNNSDANANDKCLVTATIKNPSSIDVTTTITLSGGGNKAKFESRTVTLTIPAHSSRTISSSFLVKNVELNGWCAVSTSDGTSARRGNLELRPF